MRSATASCVAGDRLPPIRTVAAQLALSPTTVSAAWALLGRSGAVSTDGRRGTTVRDQRGPAGGRYRQALRHESGFTLDLSTGVPDPGLLPSLGPVLAQLTSAPTTGSYLDDPVLPGLADVLRKDWPYAAHDLAVVDGAMDAMDLIVRTSLRFGDRVVVEDPGFPPLVDLLESVGVQLVGAPVDDEGLDLTALAAALTAPVAAIFLQPRAQNPVGVTMTSGARTRDRGAARRVRDPRRGGRLCRWPVLGHPREHRSVATRPHGIHPVLLEVARTGPAARGAERATRPAPRHHDPSRARPGLVQPPAPAGAARTPDQ